MGFRFNTGDLQWP